MSVLLPLLLALMMFTMGLAVTRQDFGRILRMPQLILFGLLCQLLLLPATGFLIARAFTLTPELAIGFIAICACPGGVLSNYVAFKAQGNVALSVSLTLFSSVITVFSIPLFMNLAQSWLDISQSAFSLPLIDTMVSIAKITLLPIALGMALRSFKENLADSLAPYLNRFCSLALIGYILYLWFQQRDSIMAAAQKIGLAVTALVCVVAVLVYVLSSLLKIAAQERRTLVIETSIQNSALAFTVTAVLMKNPVYAIPTVFYSVAMFLPAVALIYLANRQKR
jgi:BASS family bile acid:Na+ symporter